MNQPTHPHVSVIIVNWNGAHLLSECFNSLREQTYPNMDVILVDNGSKDNSLDLAAAYDVHVVRLAENRGFAGGNNAGYDYVRKHLSSKYIVLLNNDTKVDAHWLEELVACAERHPEAGSVGSRVRFYDKPNHLHSTGILLYPDFTTTNRGMYEEDTGQFDQEEEIFGSIGCSVLVRVEALREDSLFEDVYFAYREDDELAWRLRLRGYTSMYCPNSIVWHKHSSTSQPMSAFKLYFTERNRLLNLVQYAPAWYIPITLWHSAIRYAHQARSAEVSQRASSSGLTRGKTLQSLFAAYVAGLKLVPRFWRKRRQLRASSLISSKQILAWLTTYGTRNI